MKRRLLALLTVLAAATRVATADVVTDWNEVVLDAIRADRTPPPRATRALAMVHVAMYDAVVGIAGGYERYDTERPAPPGASAECAAAWAAHTVLVDLYPDLAAPLFDPALVTSLAQAPDGPAKNMARAWGRGCGRKCIELRRRDGASAVVAYQPSGVFGFWQPTPPAFAPALLPQWPQLRPFALATGDQFRAPPPPAFTSAEYGAAFDEVKRLGAANSADRTADQTVIAFFWEDGAGSVTPPGHWQVIARGLAARFGNGLVENARLFALLSVAQADAAIVSWDNKFQYDHLRPVTAIRLEADADGNPDTAADPSWTQLIPTPPFPSYTSGHSTFSGASARLLALYFGTDAIAFSGESPDPARWPAVLPGVVRSWASLSEAAAEAGQSRIYGGIHWQYDNAAGLAGGRAVADWVYGNVMRPVAQD